MQPLRATSYNMLHAYETLWCNIFVQPETLDATPFWCNSKLRLACLTVRCRPNARRNITQITFRHRLQKKGSLRVKMRITKSPLDSTACISHWLSSIRNICSVIHSNLQTSFPQQQSTISNETKVVWHPVGPCYLTWVSSNNPNHYFSRDSCVLITNCF